MDDTAYHTFFARPTQTCHRRYEALRAVFLERRSQKDVAQQFGFTYGTMRQLVLEFRRACDGQGQSTDCFFFETAPANRQSPVSRTMLKASFRRWPIGGS